MKRLVFIFRSRPGQFIGERYWRGDSYQCSGFFVVRTDDIFEAKMFTSISNMLIWQRENLDQLPENLKILKLEISISILETVQEKRAQIKKEK